MSKIIDDSEMLKKVLELEKDAMNRYTKQIAVIRDPRINSVLEGLKRNETEHKAEVEGLMMQVNKPLKGEG